jgi:hypothetical protein
MELTSTATRRRLLNEASSGTLATSDQSEQSTYGLGADCWIGIVQGYLKGSNGQPEMCHFLRDHLCAFRYAGEA